LALGGISAMFELRYPGIAIQAVGLTFGTLLVLLMAYHSGVIRVTEKFKFSGSLVSASQPSMVLVSSGSDSV
jgi:uncharacterized YccA/Bax inhibitor family protein